MSSLHIPQTYPSPTEMGISDFGSETSASLGTTTTHRKTSTTATTITSSKRLTPHPISTSHGSSARTTAHTINHEEIMAHVIQSIIAHKTSDEKFCECLNEKPPPVRVILPPREVEIKPIKINKHVEKVFDPKLYQKTIDSLSIQSDELLHGEHLWKVANDQKNLALTCTTKSSRTPSVKDGWNKSNLFGRAVDWGMEKEFWLSYIPSKCKIKGFPSGEGGFWTSERVSDDPKVFKDLDLELVTGNPIPPAERCARYECQLEWEVYHKVQLDKKFYERSTDSKKNTMLKKSLAHYRDYTSKLITNVKDEQSKSLRIDATAENRRYKRQNHESLDRIYKAYRILQNVEKNSEALPPILATHHLSSHQHRLWMNLLNKDDILGLITNSIPTNDEKSKPGMTLEEPPNPNFDHDNPTSHVNPEQLSCDYPELQNPDQKPPGIMWPRNISLMEIPDQFFSY